MPKQVAIDSAIIISSLPIWLSIIALHAFLRLPDKIPKCLIRVTPFGRICMANLLINSFVFKVTTCFLPPLLYSLAEKLTPSLSTSISRWLLMATLWVYLPSPDSYRGHYLSRSIKLLLAIDHPVLFKQQLALLLGQQFFFS